MKTKKCSKCKCEKPLVEFALNKCKHDGLQGICRSCKTDYNRQHHTKNKQYYLDKNRRRRAKIREYVKNIKEDLVCERCEFDVWQVLHFHHTNPKNKEYTIAMMVNQGISTDKIDKEIAKCEILCPNCHAVEHQGDLG